MLIAIGDIHGRPTWKDIVNNHPEDVDKWVFIGDYFDSFDIGVQDQINNFLDIIEFKKNNMDKVDLLIGNHDFHYLFFEDPCQYSGYNEKYSLSIHHILDKHRDLLQLATCFDDKYLFTHAGVTQTWFDNTYIEEGLQLPQLVEQLNDVFWKRHALFDFYPGATRFADPYGNDKFQSPIWVRPPSLTYDGIPGFTQVVGHTGQSTIQTKYRGFVFIDTLAHGEYMILENDVIKVGKIF